MKNIEMKSSELRDRIDSIHGCIIAYSRAYNAGEYAKMTQASADITRMVENLCGLVHADTSNFTVELFSEIAKIRTGRLTRDDEMKILSAAGFRKFIRDDVLRDKYGIEIVTPAKEKKTRVKTVKDENGNVRPMTADELRAWDEKRLAKIEKEMAAIRERMAK